MNKNTKRLTEGGRRTHLVAGERLASVEVEGEHEASPVVNDHLIVLMLTAHIRLCMGGVRGALETARRRMGALEGR